MHIDFYMVLDTFRLPQLIKNRTFKMVTGKFSLSDKKYWDVIFADFWNDHKDLNIFISLTMHKLTHKDMEEKKRKELLFLSAFYCWDTQRQ